ncbi:MAG: hypothetical protein PVJ02_04970 [Gemmatimonadota bacterium]|jgi:hypothetical protein
MRLLSTLVALPVLLVAAPLAAQSPQLTTGGFLGYQGGFGITAFGTLNPLAQGLPVTVRLRVGHTSVDPGRPADARRVFINTATNGTPVASGHTWDMGLDVVVPRGPRRSIFVGLRRSSFKANFKFVGGNEDFDVTSTNWGLAAGMEATFPISWKMDLVASGGAEAFLSSRLKGHDTSYSPDGQNVNPREDFTYRDADRAVGQPKFRPVLLLGVSYRLGW